MDRRLMLSALGGLAGLSGLALATGGAAAADEKPPGEKKSEKIVLNFAIELDASEVKAANRANVPCNIKVSNQSTSQIVVVMDTNREGDEMTTKDGRKIRGMRIVGAGSAVFHPGLGDKPTYHVWNTEGDVPVKEIHADSFATIWFNPFPHTCGDINWTGSKLERD